MIITNMKMNLFVMHVLLRFVILINIHSTQQKAITLNLNMHVKEFIKLFVKLVMIMAILKYYWKNRKYG